MAEMCLVKFAEPNSARMAIRRLQQEAIRADSMEVMSQPTHASRSSPRRSRRSCAPAPSGAASGPVMVLAGDDYGAQLPARQRGDAHVSPDVGLITHETDPRAAPATRTAGALTA
jgi:hypothetical protein